jgi:biotin operon repressor
MGKNVLEKVVAAGREIVPPETLEKDIRKKLSHPMTEGDLADALDCSPAKVRTALKKLRADGANIQIVAGNKFLLTSIVDPGGTFTLKAKDRGDGWTVFGFLTDKHLGNKHQRLDVHSAAYKAFEAEGITDVLDAGNWIDGEARFNKNELLVHGMDNQIDYWVEKTPMVKGITTHFISGDDHEGWYAQRECLNIGSYAQMRAEKQGRNDLRYLGNAEADIVLKCGKGSSVLRLMHPGGGSSYAMSYAPQKIVESFQGGEKPPVLLIGHYHKFDYCFPREVHVVSGGCGCDQTLFMRKKKISAHVGYSIIRLKQNPDNGVITRFQVEWVPFYDRGFYEKRFE